MSARRHGSVFAGLVFGVTGLVTGLAMGPGGQADRTVVGVSGGDRYIFRVYDDNTVDFLDLQSAKTTQGIADWTMVAIDEGRLSRRHPAR